MIRDCQVERVVPVKDFEIGRGKVMQDVHVDLIVTMLYAGRKTPRRGLGSRRARVMTASGSWSLKIAAELS